MEEIFAETVLVQVEDSAITPTRGHALLKGWEAMNTAVALAEENGIVPQ